MDLSVVSPVYKAEHIIRTLVERITEEVAPLVDTYEIVLVDDGSPGRDWDVISEICTENGHVVGVRLSRNFGQQAALRAALRHARGDYVVVMDCDLQDNPKYIATMLEKTREGYDIVLTQKTNRSHGFLYNLAARAFHALFNLISDEFKTHSSLGAFSLLTRKAVDAFCLMSEPHSPYTIVVSYLGFKTTIIPVRHDPRYEGASSYTFVRLMIQAIDGIVSYSDKLLRVSIGAGLVFCVLSVIGAARVVILYFTRGSQPGWSSLMVMICLSTGVILISLGILGIYLGKVFEQVKQRPPYLIDEVLNYEADWK